MNRVLVRLYVPLLEKQYDIWIPINKSVYYVVQSFLLGIDSMNKIHYIYDGKFPKLYNKATSDIYDMNLKIIDTDIRNGTELILF